MTTFWDITPCSLVEVDRRFSGEYCLLHQGDEAKLHKSAVAEIDVSSILITTVQLSFGDDSLVGYNAV
jgi:hypothetical protein